jgi:hypothetical protein
LPIPVRPVVAKGCYPWGLACTTVDPEAGCRLFHACVVAKAAEGNNGSNILFRSGTFLKKLELELWNSQEARFCSGRSRGQGSPDCTWIAAAVPSWGSKDAFATCPAPKKVEFNHYMMVVLSFSKWIGWLPVWTGFKRARPAQ